MRNFERLRQYVGMTAKAVAFSLPFILTGCSKGDNYKLEDGTIETIAVREAMEYDPEPIFSRTSETVTPFEKEMQTKGWKFVDNSSRYWRFREPKGKNKYWDIEYVDNGRSNQEIIGEYDSDMTKFVYFVSDTAYSLSGKKISDSVSIWRKPK